MSARVVPLDDADALHGVLEDLRTRIAEGEIRALALVCALDDGGCEPVWGAVRSLGPHAGTVLRGMVAYLGARMDAEALAPTAAPIAYGGGDTWTP